MVIGAGNWVIPCEGLGTPAPSGRALTLRDLEESVRRLDEAVGHSQWTVAGDPAEAQSRVSLPLYQGRSQQREPWPVQGRPAATPQGLPNAPTSLP